MGNSTEIQMRAERLKELRKLSGLTRAAIERKHGLSANTLNSWERGSRSGISDEGARRIIYIYQAENINCTAGWLLYGEGPSPSKKSNSISQQVISPKQDYLATISAEIEFFISQNPEAIVHEIKDDTMEPSFKSGDIVGGIRYHATEFSTLIFKDCIVETETGLILFRKLGKSTIADHFNLLSLNVESKIEKPTIYDVKLTVAAPVSRIWRGKRWQL